MKQRVNPYQVQQAGVKYALWARLYILIMIIRGSVVESLLWCCHASRGGGRVDTYNSYEGGKRSGVQNGVGA
jgi:hypothetical protein